MPNKRSAYQPICYPWLTWHVLLLSPPCPLSLLERKVTQLVWIAQELSMKQVVACQQQLPTTRHLGVSENPWSIVPSPARMRAVMSRASFPSCSMSVTLGQPPMLASSCARVASDAKGSTCRGGSTAATTVVGVTV